MNTNRGFASIALLVLVVALVLLGGDAFISSVATSAGSQEAAVSSAALRG